LVSGVDVGDHPTMAPEAETLPEDPALPQAMVLGLRARIAGVEAADRARDALVEAPKITITTLKRQRFGPSSEKIERDLVQLEPALESLEAARAAADPTPEPDAPEAEEAPAAAPDGVPPQRRRGKPRLAADALRETVLLDPGERCPDWGGALRLVGEDVAETLDFVAAKLKVVEIRRPKTSCRTAGAWCRRRRRRARSRAAWPGPSRWRTFWSPGTTTRFRSAGRARSSPAWAPTSPAPR